MIFVKLFKTAEEKAKILLSERYHQLYELSKEEIDQILINLKDIKWGNDIADDLYQISGSFDHRWGKGYTLFNDKNRDKYKTIDIIRYKYYPDGVTIDGIKKPTEKFKFVLRIDIPGGYHSMEFDNVEEIHKFIWE